MRDVFIHGKNLREKEEHRKKYKDAEARQYLTEIRAQYDEWHRENTELVGPGGRPSKDIDDDKSIITRRVELFEAYKVFLDQQLYAEKFDARGNLHSSVLEEFMFYLFRDLVNEFGQKALIGKSHTFKDIFFAPPNYTEMLVKPHGRIEIKDHDFVIGATVNAVFTASEPKEDQPASNRTRRRSKKQIEIPALEPITYDEIATTATTEAHAFDIPVIAIECKTYLDKNMLEGSSRAAEELKARNPNALYIVVMERIKLADRVNLKKYKVDQIYVLRKQKNTDREFTFDSDYVRNLVDPAVVWHLFNTVREHLTSNWLQGVEHGIQRGWLI
jgi:hypothetical protein